MPPRAAGLFIRSNFVQAALSICCAIVLRRADQVALFSELLNYAMRDLKSDSGYDIEMFSQFVAHRSGLLGSRHRARKSIARDSPYMNLVATGEGGCDRPKIEAALDYRCSRIRTNWGDKPEHWSFAGAAPYELIPIELFAYAAAMQCEMESVVHPIVQSKWYRPDLVVSEEHELLKPAEACCANSLFPSPALSH